jgi:hypothetical protein
MYIYTYIHINKYECMYTHLVILTSKPIALRTSIARTVALNPALNSGVSARAIEILPRI